MGPELVIMIYCVNQIFNRLDQFQMEYYSYWEQYKKMNYIWKSRATLNTELHLAA